LRGQEISADNRSNLQAYGKKDTKCRINPDYYCHDWRVIDTSRWIWCPILHFIILRTRPSRSAKAYAKVWGEEGSEAPLVAITRAQAVYPQFAGATTASVYDGVAKALMKRMDVPELRYLRDYHDDPRYIKCLGDGLKAHLATLDWTPDVVMTSYHGLPQSYVEKGDPYQGECIHTTDLLRAHLGMSQAEMRTTFQSRFGPKAWLQPYTDKTLEAMPDEGTKKVVPK